MSHDKPSTVRYAHDIAAQFRYLPDDEASAAVANHIRLSWDPRMRRQLDAEVDAGGELDPLVRKAVDLLRQTAPR